MTIVRAPYSYRDDHLVPVFTDDRPIIIFDGYCALCARWAKFVLKRDTAQKFRLLAAQSALGRALYVHYGLNPQDYETNVLIENGSAYFKSEGSIRMVEGLGFPWSLAIVLRLLPMGVRDKMYEYVARNRLNFFGKRENCFMPEKKYASRFLQ